MTHVTADCLTPLQSHPKMLALPMEFGVNREMVLSTTGFVMLLVCLSTFSTPTAELRGSMAGSMPQSASASLPVGYRAVTVSGVRYYTVGGVYYRPQIYQGRTVYVAVRL